MENLIISMIETMKNTNLLLNKIIEDNDTRLVTLPQAGKKLGISKTKLRQLIANGTLRHIVTNDNPTRKRICLNLTQARQDLIQSGYYVYDESGYIKKQTRGRKIKNTI